MKRVVSLYLPNWPTDRLRRIHTQAPSPYTPLVLVGLEARKRVVVAVDLAARRLGQIAFTSTQAGRKLFFRW